MKRLRAIIEHGNLTEEEIKHIAEDTQCKTFDQLKETFEHQAEMRIRFTKNEPCWEYKSIAIKLGFPV